MKLWVAVCLLAFSGAALAQQSNNPVSDVLRQMLVGREKDTVAAFEEMPADKYSFSRNFSRGVKKGGER